MANRDRNHHPRARLAPAPIALTLGALAVLAVACTGTSEPAAGNDPSAQPDTPTQAANVAPEDRAVAYFAGGCFWGVEHFLEKLPGVISVESGYMGGHIDNPSYEQVVAHQTGHLESVRVNYDRSKISYEAIAKRFFEIHDPTQANGQGPDIGEQYLSAVFVANAEERKAVESLIQRLRDRDYDVVTEIKPVSEFFTAEEYHQDYYVRKGTKPYCHGPVDRFGDGA